MNWKESENPFSWQKKRDPGKNQHGPAKGVNDEEWKSLAELAKKNKLDVRFIELMPIGQGRAEKAFPVPGCLEN